MKRTTRLSALFLALLSAAAVTTGCDNVAFNEGNVQKQVDTPAPRVTEAWTTVDHSTTEAPTEAPVTEAREEETSGEFELTTARPKYDDYTYSSRGVIVLTGTCERNATLTVSGSTFKTFSTTAHEKRWFIAIDMKNNDSDQITITAQVKGKNASKKLQLNIANEDAAAVTTFVGNGSMLFYPDTKPDYIGNNLWNDSQKNRVTANALKRLERTQDITGKDTKVIYLIAPNKLTIHPENAPDDLAKQDQSDNSRLRQFYEIMDGLHEDIMVVNLIDYMLEMKEEDGGRLYYQTDTHWNTYGSYFAYYQLMNMIYDDCGIAGTKPHELDEMDVYDDYHNGGDLVNFLGLNGGEITETTTYCTYAGNRKAVQDNITDGTIRSKVDDASLPSLVVMRDSFGAAMVDHLSEHFDNMLFTPWNCGLSACYEYMKTEKPDYFLQVLVERSIGTLLNE